MNFTGEPAVKDELDRTMKIGEDVMRHLIVRTDEP
jgi:ribosomal protein S6